MVTRLTNYTKQFWILLSTDDMDTLGSHNGDEAIVIDQDKRYVFDEENQTWRQIPMSGSGGGGGGGGGAVLIASGTFTGDGAAPSQIPVGKKMPKTDFIFNVWVDNGTEITPPNGTNRTYVWVQIPVQKRFGEYDLSTDGQKFMISKLAYPTVNTSTGVTTERTPEYDRTSAGGFVRFTTAVVENLSHLQIKRSTEGFSVLFQKGNDYTTASGVTYNWELLYFGSTPQTDIVEVA